MEQLCYIYFKPNNPKSDEGAWFTNMEMEVHHLPSEISSNIRNTSNGFYDTDTHRFREFNYTEQDWTSLIQEYIFHNKIVNKYYYLYLLRILYTLHISKFQSKTFKEAVDKLISANTSIKDWLIKDLYRYISFASYNRQKLIIQILNEFGYNFEEIQPQQLVEAMKSIDEELTYRGMGIFAQFKTIFSKVHKYKKENNRNYLKKLQDSNNEIILLMLWINDCHSMISVSIIDKYFYYLPLSLRTLIIRKLFEEHKNSYYQIDIEHLESLLSSRRRLLADYQSSLFSKSQEQNLSLEILINAIKNYTKQQTFLTINGVIDLTIQQLAAQKTKINLDAQRIFDVCNGGLRINPQFNGFLNVEYNVETNPELSLENFKEYVNTVIDRLHNIKNLSYDDLIYVQPLIEALEANKDDMPQLILFLKTRYPENNWSVKNADEFSKCLIPELISIKNAKFTIKSIVQIESVKSSLIDEKQVRKNIVHSLNEWTKEDNQEEWIVPIQKKEIINRILKGFYTHNIGAINKPFLIDWKKIHESSTSQMSKSNTICYGNLSDKKHHILDTDFVWCHRQPCFRTSITKKESWQNYRLIDFLNILGYTITQRASCGLIANEEYKKFVDTILKAQKIVDKLQCQKCGHILFPARRAQGGYSNEYTYYHCENTQCEEYHKEIYINLCFNCKEGLIDSRESKRCSNGMCICPDCLACCSNDFFDRIANRFLTANKPVPQWLNNKMGKGHKDLGILFCPKCGTEFNDSLTECPSCHYKWKTINYKNRTLD